MPFFALWAHRDAGIPIEFIGLLLGCYAGGELLATPFVGGIADRVGRRPVLLASTAGVGCGFLLLFIVRGPFGVAAALITIGAFESVLHPTAATVIADVVPAESRREHFAANRVMSNAGNMVGPALGALLALKSLALVFLGAAVTILAGALVVALFLDETRPSGAEPGKDGEDEESLLAVTAVFRDSRLAGLLAPIALLEIAVELDPGDHAALCRCRRHADRSRHRCAVRLCGRARGDFADAGDGSDGAGPLAALAPLLQAVVARLARPLPVGLTEPGC